MLASLPPYQCIHCGDLIHWSDSIHESYCAENVKNRCPKCHQKFQGDKNESPEIKLQKHLAEHRHSATAAARALFPGSCAATGVNSSWCRYCGLAFLSSLKSPAKFKSFVHESNCKFNPQNQCRFCGIQVSGWGKLEAAQESRRKHEAVCRQNADCRASCRYCGLTFQNLAAGILCSEQVNVHETRCRSNPHNRCPHCGVTFPGQSYLMSHFTRCVQKREADLVYQRALYPNAGYHRQPEYCQYHVAARQSSNPVGSYFDSMWDGDGYQEDPTNSYPPFEGVSWSHYAAPSYSPFEHQQQQQQWQSDDNREAARHHVDAAIAEIEMQLMEVGDEEQQVRRELKRLLLIWHPDKNRNNTDYDDRVSSEVFRYVNERWKELNNNRSRT